ncbi:MAG: tetratricopeptide repeat protein [Desulfovibrio sp.]|nr:tetratricopeptide repeat protein [Desulfovibrio sp.]
MADEHEKDGLAKRIQMRRVNRSLEAAQAAGKQQQKEYGDILINHLRENGQLICISDDRSFVELLRELVVKTLKMPPTSLNITARADMMAKLARNSIDAQKTPLILIEQSLNGRDLTFVTRVLKNAFPELKILMLAQETDKNHLVLLHESGVDGFLIKPLDTSGLLEKIALAIKPQDQVDRTLDWARSLLSQGEPMRALQIANQALDQQVNSSAVLLLMGDIFRAMKDYDKAADAYTRASATSALYLEPMRKLADLYAEKGELNKQIEFLEKMDEVSPLNLDRKIQIGEILLKLKRPDKARKMFDAAMKLSHRQARENVSCVAYRVADLYTDTDPAMAASFLQRGLETRKEFWSHEDLATFNRLGLLLRRAGKWQEAVAEYQKALTVAPNDDGLHYNLAMAYLEGKDVEHARAMALKALAINPDLPRRSSRIASNLAAVFVSSNDRMHAMPLLRTALELDPGNEEAKKLMAAADTAKG